MIIFLDLAMQFHRVPWERFLVKIKSYGLVDLLCSWSTYYLSVCSQVVSINGTLFQLQRITGGVIKGSPHEPLLFLLYVKDNFRAIRYGTPCLLAEEIKMVYSFELSSYHQLMASIMEDQNSPDQRCGHRVIKFIATERAVHEYKFPASPGRLFINGLPITTAQFVKDLGLQ